MLSGVGDASRALWSLLPSLVRSQRPAPHRFPFRGAMHAAPRRRARERDAEGRRAAPFDVSPLGSKGQPGTEHAPAPGRMTSWQPSLRSGSTHRARSTVVPASDVERSIGAGRACRRRPIRSAGKARTSGARAVRVWIASSSVGECARDGPPRPLPRTQRRSCSARRSRASDRVSRFALFGAPGGELDCGPCNASTSRKSAP